MWPVSHQPAGLGVFTVRISRESRSARQPDLAAALTKEWLTDDEQPVGPLARDRREGRIDLAAGAGVVDLDLQAHGAGSRFHVSQRSLGIRAWVGLTNTAIRVAVGTSARRSSSRFAATRRGEIDPVRLPSGRAGWPQDQA